MNVDQLLRACEAFAAMGSAVQDQVRNVLVDGAPLDEQNENAMRMAREWLRGVRGLDVEDQQDALRDLGAAASERASK